MVNLDKEKKIKVVREQESNILLGDISVNLVHCLLNVEDGNIYLDCNLLMRGWYFLRNRKMLAIRAW